MLRFCYKFRHFGLDTGITRVILNVDRSESIFGNRFLYFFLMYTRAEKAFLLRYVTGNGIKKTRRALFVRLNLNRPRIITSYV